MEINRLGFLNGSGQVVAPAEIVEPWSFDGTVAEALERGEVSVDNGTVEMVATLLSGSRSYSSQRHELRVVRALHATENAISTSTKRRYHVRFRNSDANAVLLEIGDLKNEGRTIRLASGAADGWQPAVVVRCNHPDAQPALWATQVRLIAGRYEIQDPVDASAYGSPVWIDGGAVALLQDENSAVALAGLLKKLK